MNDEEFAAEIAGIIQRNKLQPQRLNSRLKLQLSACSASERWVEYIFEVEEWCLNPYGGVHGGAICSLFDTGMGMGAAAWSQKMVSTTDLSVSYLKPMNGKKYLFQMEYTNIGRRMIRVTGKAVDAENGKICATAMASFMLTDAVEKGIQV